MGLRPVVEQVVELGGADGPDGAEGVGGGPKEQVGWMLTCLRVGAETLGADWAPGTDMGPWLPAEGWIPSRLAMEGWAMAHSVASCLERSQSTGGLEEGPGGEVATEEDPPFSR